MKFKDRRLTSPDEFFAEVSEYKGNWIYRGQGPWGDLQTSLERQMEKWGFSGETWPNAEQAIIREFRRIYDGPDRNLALDDTSYCLALIRHYGGPTRFLDWTYSPYVAAQTAINDFDRSKKYGCEIWCFDTDALPSSAPAGMKEDLGAWDKARSEEYFRNVFMRPHPPKFVYSANPFHLNKRLVIQQGLFMCPTDCSAPFKDNFSAAATKATCVRLELKLSSAALRRFAERLLRMNVSSANLFPGLDGFARSLGERLCIYDSKTARLG